MSLMEYRYLIKITPREVTEPYLIVWAQALIETLPGNCVVQSFH